MKGLHLHRAALLVPVLTPPIKNGGVLTGDNTVLGLGGFKELKKQAPIGTKVIDHGDIILTPALVNCHCHLGLSWLKGKIPKGLGFSGWLKAIMDHIQKEGKEDPDARICDAIIKGLVLSRDAGVCLVGDVSNVFYPSCFKKDIFLNHPLVHLFFEKIHPLQEPLKLEKPLFPAPPAAGFSFSAHSVYTCSRKALRAIKNACKKDNLPFSIHVSESKEEIEFVKTASGPISDILKEKKRDVKGFFKTAPSPVAILEQEGLLDERTICVHCTFIDEGDLKALSKSRAWICLCPESNRYIHGELPRADRIFEQTNRVCLGTDSLASNDNLSIFSQLRSLYNAFPSIDPERLFRAATFGGAMALGYERKVGAIYQGAEARLLAISGFTGAKKEVFDFLCSEALEERMETVGT